MAGLDKIIEKHRAAIDTHGYSVQAVLPDVKNHEPGFAYTIGLFMTYHHPEIILFGVEAESAHYILSTVIKTHIKQKEALKPGQRYIDILARNLPCIFLPCAPEKTKPYTLLLQDLIPDAPVLQMVWPDSKAAFPWDADFDAGLNAAQPLLGSLTN